LLAGVAGTRAQDEAAEEKPVVGQFITVDGDLSDETLDGVRQLVRKTRTAASQSGSKALLVFEFRPGQTDFGRALSLAEYLSSEDVAFATTVAFLPEGLSGNALIPVLACDQIVMTGDSASRIGPIETSPAADYRVQAAIDLARGRGNVPPEIVRAWMDPQIELFRVQTEDGAHFVLGSELEKFSQEHEVRATERIVAGGEAAAFSGVQGRELGFVQLLEDNRTDVARAFGLPREALIEQVQTQEERRAVQIHINGSLAGREEARQAFVMFDRAKNEGKNLIIFVISSEGGDPATMFSLAEQVKSQDPSTLYTVAYLKGPVRADAAALALACDEIILGENAVLGGPPPMEVIEGGIELYSETIREIAQAKYRSPALAEAMINPHIEVFRYRRGDGVERFMTVAEAANLPDIDDWQQGERVAAGDGQYLETGGREAIDVFRLASGEAESFEEVRDQLDLDYNPPKLQPGWADKLAEALRDDWVATFLLFVGIMALWTEMQAPTAGVGFLVGGLCLMLYFWGSFLNGTLQELEIILLVAGVLCLLLEIFVLPGFGIFGLVGGLLVIVSLILASQTFVIPTDGDQMREMTRSMLIVVVAGFGAVIGAMVLHRFLPYTPLFNHLMLTPPGDQDLASEEQARDEQTALLVGQRGESLTRLVPAGKAQIGDRYLDVVAEGQFIERGTLVEVVEARGNRIVVRSVEDV
jgi:membrane-bound serine protease (ClpP class)